MSEMSSINSSSSRSDSNSSIESTSTDKVGNHETNLKLEGCVLRKYNILCELGKGSNSIVWLAYCIENSKYYAIKVQDPEDYEKGVDENHFVKRLPNSDLFNKLIEDFVEIVDNRKFLCTVYHLYACDLDYVIRKGKYNDGLPFNIAIKILKQLLQSCEYLHNKMKVLHGDIKTDNILLKGKNKKIQLIMKYYDEMNFSEIYNKAKKELSKKKLTSEKKLKIRSRVHYEIYNKIKNLLDTNNLNNYDNCDIDDKYIERCEISLADFGYYIEGDEYYDESFATIYYRSPENILVGKAICSTDIWSIGCTFYELLTGRILFDPEKDKHYSREFYHLKLINEACGNFPISFLKKTELGNKYFKRGKIQMDKDLNYKNKIENKIKSVLPNEDQIKLSLKLLDGMLKINPSDRLSARKLLEIIG